MSFDGHRSITHRDGSTKDSWQSYDCGYCGIAVSGAVVSQYNWQDNAGNRYENK